MGRLRASYSCKNQELRPLSDHDLVSQRCMLSAPKVEAPKLNVISGGKDIAREPPKRPPLTHPKHGQIVV